jgi:hypothetical protein
MTTRPRPDFVNVRLSAVGLKMAGAPGTVGWANGRRHFHFVAGEIQEVERSFEWNHLLSKELYQGEPILEEVLDEPDAPPAPALPAALHAMLESEPREDD